MLSKINIAALPIFLALCAWVIWYRRKGIEICPRRHRALNILVVSAAIGAWLYTGYWSFDSVTRVLGFPFTAAIYEYHDGKWFDYVGHITIPALIANFLFWLLLFRLPLTSYLQRKTEKPNKACEATGDNVSS